MHNLLNNETDITTNLLDTQYTFLCLCELTLLFLQV